MSHKKASLISNPIKCFVDIKGHDKRFTKVPKNGRPNRCDDLTPRKKMIIDYLIGK